MRILSLVVRNQEIKKNGLAKNGLFPLCSSSIDLSENSYNTLNDTTGSLAIIIRESKWRTLYILYLSVIACEKFN